MLINALKARLLDNDLSNSVLTIDWVKKNAYKRRISVESERLPYPIIIDEIHHELNKNKKTPSDLTRC